MMRRRIFEVVWVRASQCWCVKRRSGQPIKFFPMKEQAVDWGAKKARRFSVAWPTQLVVHNKDGRITFERTYPRQSDPAESPG